MKKFYISAFTLCTALGLCPGNDVAEKYQILYAGVF